jgi:UV DNA damage endonuclease
VNALCERRLQFNRWRDGEYSEEDIRAAFRHNVDALLANVDAIASFASCFRLSSGLLPVADHISRELWADDDALRLRYTALGQRFQSKQTRVVMHPGQFCVLSSESEQTRETAVRDLEVHAWILDAMGLPRTPYTSLILHGGKGKQAQRLIDSILDLPEGVRTRLVLENDECSYSLRELLPVHERTGVPLVFDSHHHTFKPDGLSTEEAFQLAVDTWPQGVRPLQHMSNSRPDAKTFAERRAHSDYITTPAAVQIAALREGRIDLEVEAKAKNLAVARLAQDFNLRIKD